METEPAGKLVGLKIERLDPERDAKLLAERMANKYQFEYAARGDAREFRAAAQSERQKGTALKQTLFDLREWKKNPPEKISRMDPMQFYEEDKIEAEIKSYQSKAQRLDELAANREELAMKAHNEAVELQGRIKKIVRGADVDVVPVDALIPKGRERS